MQAAERCRGVAKHHPPYCGVLPYVAWVSGMYPADQRIPDGRRRLQVLLPVEMVVELDVGMARSQTYLSRSKVVALALRRFIDDGGLEALPANVTWSAIPEPRRSSS